MTMQTKTRPAHEIRLRRVRASIWMNQSDKNGPFYSVTFSRLYKSGDAWKTSDSFGSYELTDLPLVAKLARLWIRQKGGSHAAQASMRSPAANA